MTKEYGVPSTSAVSDSFDLEATSPFPSSFASAAINPVTRGGYAFQHLPDPWRLSEVYIQPASKRTFFTKSATVHNTLSKHAKPQPSTPLKSRNALQWTKKKEERVPQSRLLPRSFDDRRSHNCGRLWHGKTDYTTDGETQQYRAIPRNKQIDRRFGYELGVTRRR